MDGELSCHDLDGPGQAPLPVAARCLFGRMMGSSPVFLRHADHLAGRLIAFPWRLGELDSTLISVVSGNGAEGRVSDETEREGGHGGDSQEVWHAGIWPG